MTRPALDLVVYDAEIVKCIPERGVPNDPMYEYCAGQEDYAGMGVAVIAAFDTRVREYRVFLQDNLDAFATLIDGRTVAGFNNKGFDDRLLAANGIIVGHSFDLLCALRKACGEPETYTRGRTKAGRTVNDVAAINLGERKTGSGAEAPRLWQQGKTGRVIDYCLADVRIEARLVQKLPNLLDPVTGLPVVIDLPPFALVGGMTEALAGAL